MASPYLILSLIFALCLSCAPILEPWYQGWSGSRNQSAGVLNALIGDSRRMFANHFFAKADAYFHSGYYPTIFDSQKRDEESHLTGGHESEKPEDEDHQVHDENKKDGFLGKPRDWIDRFGRQFFPVEHSHLEKGGERELLPWLRLSAELDPQRVDTYTIASYWLRSRLGKVSEAEEFLREGLRANPDSYEIYYELGRIYNENRHEPQIARNLWEVALGKWNLQLKKFQAEDKPELKPNDLVYEGITGRLAKLEEEQGNLKQAIHYLELLKENSPATGHVQKQIQELQERLKSDGPK